MAGGNNPKGINQYTKGGLARNRPTTLVKRLAKRLGDPGTSITNGGKVFANAPHEKGLTSHIKSFQKAGKSVTEMRAYLAWNVQMHRSASQGHKVNQGYRLPGTKK